MSGQFPEGAAFVDLVASRVHDPQRLAAVADVRLLDTEAEEAFDRIARLAARLLDAPFGFITIVDDRRSFWKACIGIDAAEPARENDVEESFCQYVIGLDDVFLIDDATLDERTRHNPSIESMGVRAWAGAPLRNAGGDVLGTVCVVDTGPRSWTLDDARLLMDLAGIAGDEIAARRIAGEALDARLILEEVLTRSPIGFGLLDDQFRYVMANQALVALDDRLAPDLIGRTVAEVMPDVAGVMMPLLESVLATGEPVDGVEIVTPNSSNHSGVDRTWSGTIFRIGTPSDGRRIGLLVSDITDRTVSRRRAERLAAIAAELATATTRSELGRVVGGLMVDYFGGSFAAAGLVDLQRRSIEIITDDTSGEVVSRVELDGERRTVYSEAFRTGSPVLVPDLETRLADFPDAVPDKDVFDAMAALPLRRVDGTVIGVLVIGWPHPLVVEDFPRSQLITVAEVLGQTMERIQASEERSTLANAMQDILFANPPKLPGVDIAVRYVPASSTIGFGGDWYDVIHIDDNRFALVVGDVVGHDPVAAARMSSIRTVVATLIRQRVPLAQVCGDAEVLMADERGTPHASIGICEIDTLARTLTVVSAGHPPFLLADPQGIVRYVEQSLRPWFGVSGTFVSAPPQSYEPGSTILGYTDGLIETRGSDIDADIARLSEIFAGCVEGDAGVDDVADELLIRLVGDGGASDDVAVIVARI